MKTADKIIHYPGIKQMLFALFTIASMQAWATGDKNSATESRVDYLSFARGVTLVDVISATKSDASHALRAIDGSSAGFSLASKPGNETTSVSFVYKLPAVTTFDSFAVPNVTETPSPYQTFIQRVSVFGSATENDDSEYQLLAQTTLTTHEEKNQISEFSAAEAVEVRWVKVVLAGGIQILKDKTFFEFSEIMGFGKQAAIPLDERFTGKWKGRGVLLELQQSGSQVTGCYDRTGDLVGAVDGNVLVASGTNRTTGNPSSFVLTLNDQGEVDGVRSTNGAPFRRYFGAGAPDDLVTGCEDDSEPVLGCDSVVYGINFDYDSAVIQSSSAPVLDALFEGLEQTPEQSIIIEGHTSSEGSETYNQALSERRAQSVVNELVARGLSDKRVSASGLGESSPIANNDEEAGRVLNRRVEIECQ
ncbi:MAG: OmpA family protein [Pseudomonadota bacterium]